MKRALLSLSLLIASSLLPLSVGAQTAPERVGTFKSAEGPVQVVSGTQQRQASPGQALHVNERVVTGPKGAAAITLRDGTVLTMGQQSQMDMSAFAFDSTTQQGSAAINLLQGSLRVVTGLLGKVSPDRFKVTTPTSVVGVRGTDFIVEANPAPTAPKRRGSRSPRATMM